MKKVFYTALVGIFMFVATSNVSALTTFNDWTTGEDNVYGFAQAVSDTHYLLKGSIEIDDGPDGNNTHVGPYAWSDGQEKFGDEKGITEEIGIYIDLEKLSVNEKFHVSLSYGDYSENGKGYESEILIDTVKKDENTITVSHSDAFSFNITESGLYTYRWHLYKDGENYKCDFTVLKGETEVKTETITLTSGKYGEVTESLTAGYLWFVGIDIANGLNVYTSAPEITFDSTSESLDAVVDSKDFNDTLLETLKDSKDEKLNEFIEKNDVTVSLVSEEVEATEEEKAEFEKSLEDGNIAGYVEIDIKVSNGEESYNITELTKEIKLAVLLPKMPELASGYTRNYYILREHNGVVDKIDATLSEDGKSLVFASDKFSKYAIVYVDSKVEEQQPTETEPNPNTYDASMSYMGLALLSLGTIIASIRKLRNN